MTIDSFNKHYNRIFSPSEQLPGELLPFEYIQRTRPIIIFDEPQSTVNTPRAKEAVRALHPLFALRYSATHRESPNRVYRLTPFDAYRENLVKKIQVIGVTERENFNRPYLALESVTHQPSLVAEARTYVYESGRAKEATVKLRHGDNLFAKTKRPEHEDTGYIVREVNAASGFVEFENGERLFAGSEMGPSRKDIFRKQIEETVEQHMKMQQHLRAKGIKVLSLFFIDRVANYTGQDGVIRQIFDEAFDKLKRRYVDFKQLDAADVQAGYFAERSTASGEREAFDATDNVKDHREARKKAYELIMKKKEELLSFEEPVSFIFAHSALKEGWDNPNVFQICTLNQTVSDVRKRQEIGRGLRICVNQHGERVFAEDINVLTVVANESYQSYADRLQSEYVEDGETQAPPKPTNAKRQAARRNDDIFTSEDFKDFFQKLLQTTSYELKIDSDELVDQCIERLNAASFPDSVVVVEKGRFVVTEYSFHLKSVSETRAVIDFDVSDTEGNQNTGSHHFKERDRFTDAFGDARLRGYRITKIHHDENPRIDFDNGITLHLGDRLSFQLHAGQVRSETRHEGESTDYPVFNLVDRAARETGLTRPTLNRIFKGINGSQKEHLFRNPEGFSGRFVSEVKSVLSKHVAENVVFTLDGTRRLKDLGNIFPLERDFPQKELIDSGPRGLYDYVQHDSEVEVNFIQNRLKPAQDQVRFYFKFPPALTFEFPSLIGNYNPDWGIVYYDGDDVKLELVRETKGSENIEALQWTHEKRKIVCARKLFDALGVDYRTITDDTTFWWKPRAADADQLDLDES